MLQHHHAHPAIMVMLLFLFLASPATTSGKFAPAVQTAVVEQEAQSTTAAVEQEAKSTTAVVEQDKKAKSTTAAVEKMQPPTEALRSTTPVTKRIQWFVSPGITPAQTQFLLSDHADIVDGIYLCCGGATFDSNGTVSTPTLALAVLKPFFERSVPVWFTFGANYLPLAAWEKRDSISTQLTAWVLENNLTGIHNDWETHGDDGVDAYKFFEFWRAVGAKLHSKNKKIGFCVETAPANISHPWVPRTPNNDTRWHSYLFNWDYPLALDYADVITNMATYPMMHTTDGNNEWCETGFPNTTWCTSGCENFVDHLTPAYKFLEQEECDPNRHTVAKWCGLKGHVQDMIDVGTKPSTGQLSPGIWMNNCGYPDSKNIPLTGVTAQGWTQDSLRSFLQYLDIVGVRSIDLWTSNLSDNDLATCDWFLEELERWRAK